MKKFLAWMLMAVLVLSFSAAAFAAAPPPPPDAEKMSVEAGADSKTVPSPGKGDVDPWHRPVGPIIPIYVDGDYTEPAVPAQNGDGWGPAVPAPKTTVAVLFSDNTSAVGDIMEAPYDAETEAARSVAANAVKDVDTAITALEATDPDAAAVLKAFFEKNGDNISQGVITIPEGSANGASVKVAVNAIGKGIVMFSVPADAANLGYVILP